MKHVTSSLSLGACCCLLGSIFGAACTAKSGEEPEPPPVPVDASVAFDDAPANPDVVRDAATEPVSSPSDVAAAPISTNSPPATPAAPRASAEDAGAEPPTNTPDASDVTDEGIALDGGVPPTASDASVSAQDAGVGLFDAGTGTLGDAGLDGEGIDASAPSLVSRLSLEEPARAPLARLLEVSTEVPTRIGVTVTVGHQLHWQRDFEGLSEEHVLPLLGFLPDETYTVHVTVRLADGTALEQEPLTFSTAPLPEDWPPFRIEESRPDEMEPGLTLFGVRSRDGGTAYTVVLDSSGQVVWYATRSTAELRQLADGTILYMGAGQLRIMNMLGEITQAWHGTETVSPDEGSLAVAVPLFHHEVFPMTNGHYLSLTRNVRSVADYPTSYTPGAPGSTADVVDDRIIEFDPVTAEVAFDWSLQDMLDPRRLGYDSLNMGESGYDWGHANAVIHVPADDSYIVSLRHQDAVVKVSRATGELVWILGPHDNWSPQFEPYLLTPVGAPFEWPYHQHAPMLTTRGTVVMFDNGNHRASPPAEALSDAESYSRAVEYEVDEVAMEVRQVWEYGGDVEERLYAGFIGDADSLPTTRNVLMVFGGISYVGGEPVDTSTQNSASARILEVSGETPARKLFELVIDDAVDGAGGWTVARATRISSLYAD